MIPKFRAWNPHEKKMVDDTELVIWGGNIYQGNRQKIFERIVEGKKGLIGYSIDDKYLMQSTGLKDKNGVEIFEGDVVDYNGRKAIIKWHGSYASFIYRFVDELRKIKSEWNPLYLSYYRFEIVGNIYENPELLND